jgi:hypothetical protein
MTFIKLSNIVINSRLISSIAMHNNKYIINVLHYNVHGSAIGVFGSMYSDGNQIEISKKDDYDIITNWIDRYTKSSFK